MSVTNGENEINYASGPRSLDDTYPATEAGVVDNASIFSDSVDFDAAEKPGAPAAATTNEHEEPPEDSCTLEAPTLPNEAEQEPPEHEQHAKAAVKPRKTPKEQPTRWEPVSLSVPQDDPDDEFDIGTAQKPVFYDEEEEKPKNIFENGEPDMKGEVVSCFDEPGLLYRIIDKKKKTWAFYNDSLAFEVHVKCTFGKHSKLEALENTTMHRASDGSYIAEVVVYPCETEMFVKGFVNGFNSCLRALPLSDEYYAERQALQHSGVVEVEIENVRALVGDERDSAKVATACVENNLPFVDLEFLPEQKSVETGSGRQVKQVPWFRPRMYVHPSLVQQLRLFRKAIVPGDVSQGELGDCWLMCAIATLEENPDDLMQLFRHPGGAEAARRERESGAYRVTLNKNGLWNSIVVDDYFPAVGGTPKFAHSTDSCELWPAILEKAYAKMHQSYGMIQSGDPVHALTDMTGCPSSRFDDAFATAQRNGGKELFQQLQQYHESGYQMILTTAGKAPAFIAGTNTHTPIFADNPELEQILGGTGLLPGHAYTVRAVRHFPESCDLRLVRICNVWGSCEEWDGPWSASSKEWEKYPEVADACAGEVDDGKAVWMDWEHVLKYFNGGGVLYRHPAYDYRIPLNFADCRPSLVLEVSVDSPVWVCFILSNINHRSLLFESDEERGALEYPPLMISLSTTHDKQLGTHKVIRNTSLDATKPSQEKWTFMQAREISMLCKLTPEESPYLVIPRMMETEETVYGSAAWFTQLHDKVSPLHFINRDKTSADTSAAEVAEVPVVLGIRCSKPIGEDGSGGVRVNFKRLDNANVVFENFPKFSADTEAVDDVYYQVKGATQGFAEERAGPALF